ncbi:MAG: ATP synthase subunit I [Candidatus Melainabacteria bacterium]|nr:ATP synthase subunit I [Candidatus Melainabacteria bacterium]
MNDSLNLVLPVVAGIFLGTIFFGALWLTILKIVSSKQPAIWVLVSLFLRTGIALVGFYLVGNGDWKRLLLCLLGFVVGRLIVTYLTRDHTPGKHESHRTAEVNHAPQS